MPGKKTDLTADSLGEPLSQEIIERCFMMVETNPDFKKAFNGLSRAYASLKVERSINPFVSVAFGICVALADIDRIVDNMPPELLIDVLKDREKRLEAESKRPPYTTPAGEL